MANTSETGHARNLAHFLSLIHQLRGMGDHYNPAHDQLKVGALEAAYQDATNRLDHFRKVNAQYDVVIHDRSVRFKDVRQLATRIRGLLLTCNIPAKDMDNASAYIAKFRGVSSPKTAQPAPLAADETAQPARQSSRSQHSFDQQLEHFSKLNELVQLVPNYQTNDGALTKAALSNHVSALKSANEAAIIETTNLREARLARDKAMYDETTGIVALAKTVKNYLRTLPGGVNNPDFKKAAKLSFVVPRSTVRITV